MKCFEEQRWLQPASLLGKRILVVEDEFFVADEMALDLKCFGAEVVGPVPSLDDAFQILDDDPRIDGAILDINVQGEKIFSFADELRNRCIPFVFSTGYDRWSLPTTFESVPLCEKPVDTAKIAKALFPLESA